MSSRNRTQLNLSPPITRSSCLFQKPNATERTCPPKYKRLSLKLHLVTNRGTGAKLKQHPTYITTPGTTDFAAFTEKKKPKTKKTKNQQKPL